MTLNQPLIDKIEYLRNQMIETGLKHGLSSPATIKISQELDALLMSYLKEISSRDK
ncbi:hypothetical protein CJ195_22440 [Bacillus sp. UMB0899]|nr:hypothetical protein CJ195_22440 [Bacillus sp. UMB0899]